jgi:ribosome biogenesis GTP-binding protein YsxC/EngB
VLFLGSTNSGKSSLINAIQNKYVAKASQKLSKTQALSRYQFGKHPESKYILVDSPGYGYTRTPLKVKKMFRKMIFRHIADSQFLLKIYLLVNGHIGLKSTDIEILDQLDPFKRPIQIVMTKIDRAGSVEEIFRILTKTGAEIQKYKSVLPMIHITSATHHIGIKDLKTNIALTFMEDD